jgi:ABC-2 type transport system permease protein
MAARTSVVSVSVATPASRRLLGDPNPTASIHAWPRQLPLLASLLWSLALIAVVAPWASMLYRRRTTD